MLNKIQKFLKYFFSGENTDCKNYKYFFIGMINFLNKKAEIQSQPEI